MNGAVSLFLGNLVSKGSGLVREMIFAGLFGTTSVAAAYRISQTGFYAPTHALVLETVSGGLVPIYKKTNREDEERTQALLIVAFASALAVALVIGTILLVFAHSIVSFIAPEADQTTLALSGVMLMVTAVAVPFYVAGNFLGFMETAHGRYGALSSRPTLLNVVAILAALVAVYLKAPMFLALGIVVGHIAFFVWTVSESVRYKIIRFWIPRDVAVYRLMALRFFRNAAPLIALPFISQSNVIAERIVASFLGTQVIPCLDYARFLTDTTLALVSVPLGIMTMSSHGGVQGEVAIAHVNRVSSAMIALVLPVAIYLACNAYDVVDLAFARGAFNATAVANTGAIVSGLALGLGATATAYFLQMALNAQLRNVESTLIAALAAAVNITINLLTWRSLGPLALGLGATGYGLTQYIAGMVRMRLFGRQASLLLSLAAGCALYTAYYFVMPHFASLLLRLGVQSVGAVILWSFVIWLCPPLRRVVVPVITTLLRKGSRRA